jgi:PTH2 family peptidyl-tRNA hydrolase
MEALEEPKVSEPKQVIIMRKDLNMRKGKMVAQGAHASMAAIINLGYVHHNTNSRTGKRLCSKLEVPLWVERFEFSGKPDINLPAVIEWLEGRFTKVCVSVDSEQELVDIIDRAKAAGLVTSLITDAGLTEFGGVPTITCGCVGPAYPEEVDPFTGHLKLL